MNKHNENHLRANFSQLLSHEWAQNPKLIPLINNLITKSLEGVVRFERNLNHTLNIAIQQLDQIIHSQLRLLIHHTDFIELEGRWRGLYKLIMSSNNSNVIKIKILPCSLEELNTQFLPVESIEQSHLYKKLYDNEFGSPGGEPYGVLIADYTFDHTDQSLNSLKQLAKLGSISFCPILSAVSPYLFNLKDWKDLNKIRELSKLVMGYEHIAWNQFRESEEARFVYLCMPRSLARPVYSSSIYTNFSEFTNSDEAQNTNHYCWMNSAYNLAILLSNAFDKYGWCINIRGSESGGRVDNLPIYCFKTETGEYQIQCPTEIQISDQREAELSQLGLLALCYYKNTDYAVFFGAESLQKSKIYDRPEATENARISARLPYVMASARFAHYLKIMSRDKIGSFKDAAELSEELNRWIMNYVNGNKTSRQELKAKYPLAEARVELKSIPSKAGSFEAVAWLRPWLQMEELTTSLRLVAQIPEMNN